MTVPVRFVLQMRPTATGGWTVVLRDPDGLAVAGSERTLEPLPLPDPDDLLLTFPACHAPLATCEPGEVLVQFAVRDSDERKVNARFAPQVVPRVLGTVPGITYIADQGRPRASEVIAFWPALVSREAVEQKAVVGGEELVV